MRNKSLTFIIALVVISLAIPSTGHAWRHWGWYGAGAFTGGVLVGTAIARPWYYAPAPAYLYPPPPYVYAPPPVYAAPPPYAVAPPAYVPDQAYAYPDPSYAPQTASPAPPPQGLAGQASAGQWVDVPGQSVGGRWVPPHRVWVPATP